MLGRRLRFLTRPLIDDLVARLASEDPSSVRVKTLSVLALLIGTLQVSRALAVSLLVAGASLSKPGSAQSALQAA